MQKLKTLLKKLRNKKREIKKDLIFTEEQFYVELFTKDPNWNKPTPNFEENLRWNIIEKFIFYIKGYRKSSDNHTTPQILDLGCGRGWLSNLLSSYGEVTGIEPIEGVVLYAQKIFPHIDFITGTTTNLLSSGKKNHYDIIVCSEVIEHIADNYKLAFLSDIRSLLSDNGFLIITTPRKDAEAEWKKHSNPGQPIEDWIYEKDLSKLITQTNFTKHEIQRLSMSPNPNAPLIEIYQLWLIQKNQIH
jgi:2-polyprenyl-3-methyl-5-hydroxy-6-metoxy-1,4-benzoquinol methylase